MLRDAIGFCTHNDLFFSDCDENETQRQKYKLNVSRGWGVFDQSYNVVDAQDLN